MDLLEYQGKQLFARHGVPVPSGSPATTVEEAVAAADVISRNPATLQLRYLQTLSEIGVEQNSTVVFPLPIDLVKPLLDAATSSTKPAELTAGNGTPPLVGTREASRGEAQR